MTQSQELVLESIRKAGRELGRAPSRAELKRLTGVSHFVILKHFPTLRHAVEAAGFIPHIKGRRATMVELLEDYGRVARLLGRRPSRAEYVRAGKYSAGTFTQRFGGWVEAGEEWEKTSDDRVIGRSGDHPSPRSADLGTPGDLELPEEHSPQICADGRRSEESSGEELPKSPELPKLPKLENGGAPIPQLPNYQVTQLPTPHDQTTQLPITERPAFILRPGQPAEIPGMRCVTEEVAAMIVGGLLGPRKWRLEIGEVEFSRSGDRAIGKSEESPEFPPRINPDDTDQKQRELQLPNYQVTQSPNPLLSPLISTDDTDQKQRGFQLPNPLSNEIVISRRAVRLPGVPTSTLHGLGWSSDGPIVRSPDVLRRLNVEVISGRLRRDRPVMGPPLHAYAMTNAPSNEAGVAALFCMIAPDLGFQIEAIQSAFPDCEARRQVRKGKWQRVLIEFEYESRNFPLHHHDPSGCDMIVCWRHNWRKCPEEIEVLELRKVISIG
ncbi:MAG TPA: hypothetical protein VJN64_06975 [Terriglobales bacterium]|nr:hypothetical protein [Terriglobales bacterium]